MALRDFLLFLAAALVFATGNILSKYMISIMGVPPLFLAAMRYLVPAVVLAPLLWPMPEPRGRLVAGTLLLGVFAFGLFYIALRHTGSAAASIVNLSQAPIGVLLAIVLLGERPSGKRIAGTALTLAGVAAVIYRPESMRASQGLWIVLASAFCAALGAIVCSRLKDIPPLRIQAWSGFLCFCVLALTSWALEQGQWQAAVLGGWRFVGGVLFLGVVVSIIALTILFRLMQRHDAGLIASLNLLMPLMTVVLGVAVLGEALTLRMILGLVVASIGALVISGQFDRIGARFARFAAASAM